MSSPWVRSSIERFGRLAVLVVAGLLLGCGSHEEQPNIVLIYIDDLGWRDAAFMGSRYYETPHIDRLAAGGAVFTAAYANAPNCAPSRASLLTGLYPPRHGIYTVGSPERGDASRRRLIPVPNETALDTGFVTIAEALRTAGYATAHVGKWHLGGEGSLPTDHGFDLNVAGDHRGHPPGYFAPYKRWDDQLPYLPGEAEPGEYLTDRLTDEALAFIEERRGGPFFLYLAHYAVHTPHQAKDALYQKYSQKTGSPEHNEPVYAAMIESVDESVGRIMAKLEELQITERTVVFFFSDNGGFGPATSMAPLRGSKGMLYEGGIRVPFVAFWPGEIRPGRELDTPVIGTDMYPTLLEIAGGLEPAQGLDGVSLVPLLTGEGGLSPRPLHWHFPAYLEADRSTLGSFRTTPAAAARVGDFKLVEFFETGTLELYDLRADIGEQVNLVDSLPELAARLHDTMSMWRVAVGAAVPTEANPAYEQALEGGTGRLPRGMSPEGPPPGR
jgi:arylsulfatase A-like enzyme